MRRAEINATHRPSSSFAEPRHLHLHLQLHLHLHLT
jgi:hypothetical protein